MSENNLYLNYQNPDTFHTEDYKNKMQFRQGYNKINQMQIQTPESNNPNKYDDLQQQPQQSITPQPSLKQQHQQLHPINQTRYKSFHQLLYIILNVSLSSFYFGYTLAYLSSVDFGTIMNVYNISMKKQVAEGLLIGCMPIGGGIGALSSGLLIDRFSRRKSLLIVNCIAFITGILIFIPSMETLFLTRLLQGVCSGLFSSLSPLIMKQLSPREISGTLTSCNQIMIASGVFFSFVFSLFVEKLFNDPTGEKTWWLVFGFSLIILVAQSFMLSSVYNFETPKYLFMKEKDVEGRQLIELLYKPQYVDAIVQQMKRDIGRVENQDNELIAHHIEGNNKPQHALQKLTTPRSAVIVAIHLAALQQFCGINAVIAYGGQIVGEDVPSLILALPILINAEQVIASIFTSYLLTKIGRKTMFQYGCIGAAVSCLVIALGFYIKSPSSNLGLGLIILGLILFMANFGLTLGPVVWVYLPEIIQPDIMPYATGVNWGTAAFIMLLFPVIKQRLPNKNPSLLFVFFAIWCIISYFFNKKYLIQTKGKTEKEIIQDYRKQTAFC